MRTACHAQDQGQCQALLSEAKLSFNALKDRLQVFLQLDQQRKRLLGQQNWSYHESFVSVQKPVSCPRQYLYSIITTKTLWQAELHFWSLPQQSKVLRFTSLKSVSIDWCLRYSHCFTFSHTLNFEPHKLHAPFRSCCRLPQSESRAFWNHCSLVPRLWITFSFENRMRIFRACIIVRDQRRVCKYWNSQSIQQNRELKIF